MYINSKDNQPGMVQSMGMSSLPRQEVGITLQVSGKGLFLKAKCKVLNKIFKPFIKFEVRNNSAETNVYSGSIGMSSGG